MYTAHHTKVIKDNIRAQWLIIRKAGSRFCRLTRKIHNKKRMLSLLIAVNHSIKNQQDIFDN